jgi:hypothetical protein
VIEHFIEKERDAAGKVGGREREASLQERRERKTGRERGRRR